MRVLFRADASLDIGTGHVMRCLTLADALRERGSECLFVCREHPGNLLQAIRQRGHRAEALPVESAQPVADSPAHARWLGSSQARDAALCLPLLDAYRPDWLVVDHYALDARWERAMRRSGQRLLVIDDLVDRPHVCDLLLDQTLGRQATEYAALLQDSAPMMLCGADYALLRPEFARLRPTSLARREHADSRNLLISLGGVDQHNVTGRVLEVLAQSGVLDDWQPRVVMGGQAPWLEAVQSQAARFTSLEVRVDVQDMAELMAWSDLAIGAAGATSWERCCLGVPTLMAVLADNQRHVARALADCGAVRLLDMARDDLGLPAAFAQLQSEPKALSDMARTAALVTSGQGLEALLARLEPVR